MKNEDLYVYKKSDFYEDFISSQKEYYEREQVDALLAEKDREIAELKDKCQMHDFFWEGCGFAKRGFKNTITVSEAFDRLEAENAKLKQKLEDVQASAYAESVDAGMRERRLKRALWIARAERAKEKQQLFHFSLDYEKLCIEGFYDPYSGRRELSPKQWIKAFNKVEVKLLKKAEEYK